jgi:hypothetical protein
MHTPVDGRLTAARCARLEFRDRDDIGPFGEEKITGRFPCTAKLFAPLSL